MCVCVWLAALTHGLKEGWVGWLAAYFSQTAAAPPTTAPSLPAPNICGLVLLSLSVCSHSMHYYHGALTAHAVYAYPNNLFYPNMPVLLPASCLPLLFFPLLTCILLCAIVHLFPCPCVPSPCVLVIYRCAPCSYSGWGWGGGGQAWLPQHPNCPKQQQLPGCLVQPSLATPLEGGMNTQAITKKEPEHGQTYET